MDFIKTARLLAFVVACGSLGYVAFLTLSPIDMRPVVANIRVEHIAAYAVIGLSFGLAFPRRPLAALFFVIACAGCLEGLQLLESDRHGRWIDFGTKAIGAVAGMGLAFVINLAINRYWPIDTAKDKRARSRNLG